MNLSEKLGRMVKPSRIMESAVIGPTQKQEASSRRGCAEESVFRLICDLLRCFCLAPCRPHQIKKPPKLTYYPNVPHKGTLLVSLKPLHRCDMAEYCGRVR